MDQWTSASNFGERWMVSVTAQGHASESIERLAMHGSKFHRDLLASKIWANLCVLAAASPAAQSGAAEKGAAKEVVRATVKGIDQVVGVLPPELPLERIMEH